MTTSPGVEKNYLVHLTGFRAIAAYLVLISHSTEVAFSGNPTLDAQLLPLAHLGMSVFFVLSGFVITYTYYDRFTVLPWQKATWQFFVARFARLYPLYMVFLLCEQHQLSAIVHAGWPEKLAYFTLTQSWWDMQRLTFPVSWSISTECFFYMCFALWLLGGKAVHSGLTLKGWSIIAITLIYCILSVAFARQADITTLLVQFDHTTPQDAWHWFRYYSPYVRLGEFIAGVCAARVFMIMKPVLPEPYRWRRANLFSAVSLLGIVALSVANTLWFKPDSFLFFLNFNFGYAPFLAYLCYACSRYPNYITRLCSGPLVQEAGEISYSVYILQYWLSLLLTYALFPASWKLIPPYMMMLLFILLTTIAASYSYRFIEVPSRIALRKMLARE